MKKQRQNSKAGCGRPDRPAAEFGAGCRVWSVRLKKITVIVSNRNYVGFLRHTIESVLSQDYPAKELIVVDTGSTDGSREAILSYGSALTPVFLDNAGQGGGGNAGFERATGDIIFFLDSDDLMRPGALTALAEAFEDGVSHVSYCLRLIDEKGMALPGVWPEEPEPDGCEPLDCYRKWGTIHSPPQSGNAYARSFLETVMPLEAPYTQIGASHADGYFIIMSWLYGRSRHLNRELGCYRIHGANHSGEGQRANLKVVREEMLFSEDWDRRLKARAPSRNIVMKAGEGLPRSVRYQKLRFYSLRLGPADHPHAEDSRLGCLLDGFKAAFCATHKPLHTRLKYAGFFLLFATLPSPLLASIGPDLFSRESRRQLPAVIAGRVRQSFGMAAG